MARNASAKRDEIISWIQEEIDAGLPGDKLPNIRALMRRFETAQRTVQSAIQEFVAQGQLVSRSGLGIVIAEPELKPSEHDEWDGDFLVLRRASESAIATNLVRELARRFQQSNVTMLQIGYNDEKQALEVLARLGRYRACLLQGHFQSLSIDFLSALRRHTPHIISDGAYVTGIDVDAIGTDWREAVSTAFNLLRAKGHDRIGFLTSGHSARTIAMARREFGVLRRFMPDPEACPIMQIDALPGDYTADKIVNALAPCKVQDRRLSCSALITWGVVEGIVLDVALTRLGLRPAEDLSVLMLGSVDFQSEHLNRFDVIGNSDEAKIDKFEEVVLSRIHGGTQVAQNHYLDIEIVAHGSVAQYQQ